MDKFLNTRKKSILKEIIRSYIYSAEPIGSRTISKNSCSGLSPASIRNVMADLEEMGYIKQVHTSSGRIPTDKGYRFYVNDLSAPNKLSIEDINFIKKSYSSQPTETESLLEYTSKLLSMVTNHAGVVMLHKVSDVTFNHFNFIRLNPKQILCVFVTNSGDIQNRIIKVEHDTPQETLDSISRYLNTHFNGSTLDEIRYKFIQKMTKDKENYNFLLKKTIDLIKKSFIDEIENEIFVGGKLNIFDQPDFVSDIKKLKSLFRQFEEKKNLIKLLDKCLNNEGISIIIGPEGEIDDMQYCSLVTHTYRMDNKILGVLGIVGPKRMEYSKVIPMVNYTANLVSRILSKQEFV